MAEASSPVNSSIRNRNSSKEELKSSEKSPGLLQEE